MCSRNGTGLDDTCKIGEKFSCNGDSTVLLSLINNAMSCGSVIKCIIALLARNIKIVLSPFHGSLSHKIGHWTLAFFHLSHPGVVAVAIQWQHLDNLLFLFQSNLTVNGQNT